MLLEVLLKLSFLAYGFLAGCLQLWDFGDDIANAVVQVSFASVTILCRSNVP